MKMNFRNTLAMLILILPLSIQAVRPDFRSSWDSLPCLEIEGKVLNACKGEYDECKVELLYYNRVVDSRILRDGKRKFRFYLRRNARYAIRISKTGYLSRLVCIDTNVPEYPDNLYRFSFTTKLLGVEKTKNLDSSVADFPIALIYYNKERGYFYYHKKYTTDMKRALAAFN